MSAIIRPELGFYALGGQPESPRALIDEIRRAEALGLGHAFLSERFNTKEACTLSGAAAAVSEHIGIATGATNHNTRHPMVTAAYALTMHGMSNGRFTLGIGRGIPPLQEAFGMSRITTAQMVDFVGVMRRLFRGETVVGHDGPMGRYPMLRLGQDYDVDIPMGMVAFAPNSLEMAGQVMDQVILHTFFTDETLARCVQTVKSSAERAGRNPDDVKVWSCLATIGDHLPEELRLRKLVGRLATYLQGYGDLMVRTNRWNPQVLQRFRDDPVVKSFHGSGLQAIDSPTTSIDKLEHIATLLPPEWTAPAATGSAQSCAATIREQLALGADGVILHGATPTELEPILAAYSAGTEAASHRSTPARHQV